MTDNEIRDYLKKNDYTVASMAAALKAVGLAAMRGDKLLPLVRGCECAALPDGRMVAAGNMTGRLTAWILDRVNSSKA